MADPVRIAELSVPYFHEAGVPMTPDDRGTRSSWRRRWRWRPRRSIGSSQMPGAAGVPVRLRRRARRWPIAQVRDEMSGEGARAVVRGAGRGAGGGAAARSRAVSRSREPGEGADRPEGEGAVSSDPRRADRAGRRPRARSGGAGDRPRAPSCRRDAGIPAILGCRERAAAFVARCWSRSIHEAIQTQGS